MKTQLEILKEALGDYKVARNEFLFHCPFCEHKNKKLSINLEKNVWKCWICDTRGKNISYLVKRFVPDLIENWSLYDKSIITDNLEDTVISIFEGKNSKEKVFEETPVYLPYQFKKFSQFKTTYERLAYKYLINDRKLDNQDIFDYTLGFCEYGDYKGYIIIPSFNEHGKINNFIARLFTDDIKEKYTGPPIKKNNVIFNELYVDFNKPILLVEGFFDLVGSGHDNCIPLLGSLLSKESKLYHKLAENKPEVTICLDRDAIEKQQSVLETLKDVIPDLYYIELEDDRDISDLGKDKFQEILKTKERFTKEPLVNLEKRIRMIFE